MLECRARGFLNIFYEKSLAFNWQVDAGFVWSTNVIGFFCCWFFEEMIQFKFKNQLVQIWTSRQKVNKSSISIKSPFNINIMTFNSQLRLNSFQFSALSHSLCRFALQSIESFPQQYINACKKFFAKLKMKDCNFIHVVAYSISHILTASAHNDLWGLASRE
jgi:hypothetical protein